jgi:adenylate kinase family enzyme
MGIQEINIKEITQQCIKNVFRTNTNEVGFIHLDFGKNLTPYQFRSIMVDLKNELSKFTVVKYDKKLSFHWLVRFDQQVNTPFHVDNAADQSFLMLGYEPSEIESELQIADYYKYANESSTATKDYLKKFTPIFKDEESELAPYATRVNLVQSDTYTIVLINNSNPKSAPETLGVFHKAVIVKPDLSKSRIVNSMVLNMLPKGAINDNELNDEEFLNNGVISK